MFRVLAFASAGLICAVVALFDIAVAAGLWIDGRIDELSGDLGFFAFFIATLGAGVFFLMRAKQLYGDLRLGGSEPTMKDRAATPLAVLAILGFFAVLIILVFATVQP
ncbi:MAG: hypothetical protein QNJ35_09465 [Paracoccaceae bacterium]|nr:hypothetical protein [Paracoccaceae bacterium]